MKTKSHTPDCASIAAADVINSATPIECDLLGIHPRLLCMRHPFGTLHERLGTEPWKKRFKELQSKGDSFLTTPLSDQLIDTPFAVFNIRSLGGHLITLAFLYRLTAESKYRDRIAYLMRRLSDEKDWGDSLIYGYWAQGFAIALDWLWNEFDDETRKRHVETLYHRTHHVFEKWASFRSGDPFGYTWNISSVVLGGITATAACLYGERPDIAPLANMACEKLRCQSMALGPDGVSPEGIMYGSMYGSFLTVNFLLAEELFGCDLYGTSSWLARHPQSLHAQTLPRASWSGGNIFFMQGDAHEEAIGIEPVVRAIASAAHDGKAQWFADELLNNGPCIMDPLSFLLYNPDVLPVTLLDRPPFNFMEDSGIVVMRGDWSGTESACAFKCGPNIGHHATKHFTHPLAGGHMYPNNGEVQIFAHGEWILTHPGYTYKDTAFHNTILINGIGQYGEKSAWLEDLPYRKRRRYPFMERAEHHEAWDYCVADMTLAYPEELGLTQLRRHLLYIRPDTWIIVDAMESEAPIMPTLLFHTGFALHRESTSCFTGKGQKAECRIRFHAPASMVAATENQIHLAANGKANGTMPLLRMSPEATARRHLCITSLSASPAAKGSPEDIGIELSEDSNTLRITASRSRLTPVLFPFRRMPEFTQSREARLGLPA